MDKTIELVSKMTNKAVLFLEILQRAGIETLHLEDKLALLQIALQSHTEAERQKLFELYLKCEKFCERVREHVRNVMNE